MRVRRAALALSIVVAFLFGWVARDATATDHLRCKPAAGDRDIITGQRQTSKNIAGAGALDCR